MEAIELSIYLRATTEDDDATLAWIDPQQDEPKVYQTVAVGKVIKQTTFPNHRWTLTGKTSKRVLLSIVAERAPETQHHVVDEREACVTPLHAAASADGDIDADAAEDANACAEAPEDACGAWVAAGSRFERVPRRNTMQPILWRELDADGNEAALWEQVGAECNTQWFWWMGELFKRARGLNAHREAMVFYSMSMAAAYNLDTAGIWPRWLRLATARLGLGHHPGVALLVMLCLAGACVAAAAPLTEAALLLRGQRDPIEVRLTAAAGYERGLTRRGEQPAAWREVSQGRFEPFPRDLRELAKQRSHHAVFLALVALWLAARVRALLSPVE